MIRKINVQRREFTMEGFPQKTKGLTKEEMDHMTAEEIDRHSEKMEKEILSLYPPGVFERPSLMRRNKWKRRLNKVGFNFKIRLY